MTALYTRLTAPVSPPVSVDELKAHLRIDHDAEDAALADLILRATAMLDGPLGETGRCLMAQSWRIAVARAPRLKLFLPIAPATHLQAVRRIAPDGSEEALDPADFSLCADEISTWVLALRGWPALAERPDALAFDIAAGAATATGVPPALRQAILLLAGHWHANREAVALGTIATQLPLGVRHLIDLHRVGWAG